MVSSRPWGKVAFAPVLPVSIILMAVSTCSKLRSQRLRRRLCTARRKVERFIAKGRSNQGYHYLGSAKIYSRIGEALAKAIIEKKNK